LKLQIGIDGNNYELEVEVIEDDEAPQHLNYGLSYPLVPATVHSVAVPAAPAKAPVSEESGDEAKICRSPITGVVIKTNVAPGQAITENELIMVLEAMKMETNVTAPRTGVVKSVRVAAGDSVKINQVVVELE
jgi:methylmalonyl-CoA carboxyltransferase small subunit